MQECPTLHSRGHFCGLETNSRSQNLLDEGYEDWVASRNGLDARPLCEAVAQLTQNEHQERMRTVELGRDRALSQEAR